jgi:hypothetical protein
MRGEVNGEVCCGERGGPAGEKRSSEKMSVKSVDLLSVDGDVGDTGDVRSVVWMWGYGGCAWDVEEAEEEAGDIQREGGSGIGGRSW